MLDLISFGKLPLAALDFGFMPHEEDLSISYLSRIFGEVAPGLLYGQQGILAELFSLFNFVALTVAMIILIYHAVFGTIHTASDGEILGKNEHGARRLIQAVTSVSFLCPIKGSYCIAQVLVMQLVVWGIGAADNLWNATNDYFMEGGSLYDTFEMEEPPPPTAIETRNDKILAIRDGVGQIFVAKTCVELNNARKKGVWNKYEIVYYPSPNPTAAVPEPSYIKFGSKGGGSECGYMDVLEMQKSEGGDAHIQKLMSFITNENSDSFFHYITKEIGWDNRFKKHKEPSIMEVNSEAKNELDSFIADDLYPIFHETTENLENPFPGMGDREFMENLKKEGWVSAGNYYRVLLRMESTFYSSNMVPPVQRPADHRYSDDEYVAGITAAKAYWNDYIDLSNDSILASGEYPVDMTSTYNAMKAGANQLPSELAEFGMNTQAQKRFIEFLDQINVKPEGGDPLAGLTDFGYKMMQDGIIGFNLAITASVAAGALGILSSITAFGNGSPGAGPAWVGALLTATLPVAYTISAFYYAQGALLSVYLPLIPFVIFLVAGIGWIVAVIESMVAAPLVALGLIWPDSQPHVLGRAEPAVMMILNLFLRPSLLILGFVASLILVYVGLLMLNFGFQTLVFYGGFTVDGMFGPLVLEFAYVALAVMIVKKCFDLIHQVPDKVLMWIGDRSQTVGGADEALSGAKGGVETGSGQAGRVAEQAGQVGSQVGSSARQMSSIRNMGEGWNPLAKSVGSSSATTTAGQPPTNAPENNPNKNSGGNDK